MSDHFNRLTPAEAERLAYLIEEAAEVQQIACKVLRHGYASKDPTKATPRFDPNRGGQDGWINTSPNNRALIEKELEDLLGAVERMRAAGDIKGIAGDPTKGARYMHHQ